MRFSRFPEAGECGSGEHDCRRCPHQSQGRCTEKLHVHRAHHRGAMFHHMRRAGAIIQGPHYDARSRHWAIEPRSISQVADASISRSSVATLPNCAARTHVYRIRSPAALRYCAQTSRCARPR